MGGHVSGETWGWLAAYAAKQKLTYEPDPDERWLRAFEPLVTLRTPVRYTHALHSTGGRGSVSIARLVLEGDGAVGREPSSWIVFAQDERLPSARAAAASDARPTSPFAEPPELVSVPQRRTGDATFDRTFSSYAPTDGDLAEAITPSLRKLALSWRIPLHFEVRPGAFILAPVALPADPPSLAWLLGAVQFFGEKAAKRVK
ncbi:MAG: hypothetical protein ACLQBL_14510 [Polyangiaceae bacterium]